MEIILVLIFFSIIIAGSFLLAFFWAVRNGQFDDQYTPSVRMLFEDKENLVVKPEKMRAIIFINNFYLIKF
jgi:cbb3-type cytochrome oxidase maturation protein